VFVDTNKVQAQASNDSCYVFQSESGQTVLVKLISSDNQRKTITLPNQNPPSILQEIRFANGPGCALKGIVDSNNLNNFVVAGSKVIPFSENPLFLYPNGFGPSITNYAGYSSFLITSNLKYNNQAKVPITENSYLGLSSIGLGLNSSTIQIENENAIINSIDKDHKFTMKMSTGSGSATMSAPATNCVALSGNGPRKIVFMRGKSMNMTVSDFILFSNQLITDSFKMVDPFKKYFDQFSFYVDLKDFDDTKFPISLDSGTFGDDSYYFPSTMQFNYSVKLNSSCFGLAGIESQYDFFFNNNVLSKAWMGMTSSNIEHGTIFINTTEKDFSSKFTGLALIHETGHSFAGLDDEYIMDGVGDRLYPSLDKLRNCSISPLQSYRSSLDNIVYGSSYIDGSVGIKGCTFLKSKSPGAEFYKPSPSSMMNASSQLEGFNVISCGYIISAIKGEPLDKAHAETHWPECLNLNTVKDGIPTLKASPSVSKITPAISGASGQYNTYKIVGFGFTPIDNSVKLILVNSSTQAPKNSWFAFFFPQTADAQAQSNTTSYEITGIPSSDGVTLTFSVPNTVPDGTYNISVGAFNSPWANTSSTIIISGNGKGDPTTAIGATPTQTTSTNPANPILKYSCPTGYTLNSDNSCYKEGTMVTTPASTVARTVTYSCPTSPAGFENASYPSGDLMKCVGRYPSPDYVAKATYSCPLGSTLSGTVCSKPATTVTTPASYIAPTISYSCATGYVLSSNGGICSIPKTPVLSAVSFGGKINLNWTSDSLPSGSTFEIERMVRNGNYNIMAGVINYNNSYSILARVTGELRSYSDPINLPVVTTDIYSYRIRAKLADGIYTPYSNVISFTIAKNLTLVTGAQQELKKLTTPVVTVAPTPTPTYSPRTSPVYTSNPVATPYYSPASTQTSSPTPTPTPNSTPPTVLSNQSRIDAITQLYVSLLKRQPDQGGLNYFVNSSMTIDQVRSTLIASQEYKNLMAPTATPSSTNSPSPSPAPTPTSTQVPTSTSSPRPSSSPVSQMNQLNQTSQSFIASVYKIFIKSFASK
jgi:hypothetical protein